MLLNSFYFMDLLVNIDNFSFLIVSQLSNQQKFIKNVVIVCNYLTVADHLF